jgi:hypothetical protein
MDGTNNGINDWICQQIPDGATVLELCAGDGIRAIPTALASAAALWQFTDQNHGDINQLILALEQQKPALQTAAWAMAVESDWGLVSPLTDWVVVRNALHVLSPQQMVSIFEQCRERGVTLLMVNCSNLLDPKTADFQLHTLRNGGYVWPQHFVERLGRISGMYAEVWKNFHNDEACSLYGEITATGFRQVSSNSRQKGA